MNNRTDDEVKGKPILGQMTRRDFLKLAGVGGIGTLGILVPQLFFPDIVAASPDLAPSAQATYPPLAKGLVVADATRCTGCRRCEIACTSFNDGKAQPTIARIKVYRNLNFGTAGAQKGYYRGDGHFGNFLLVQDTCKQCPHPVPCQLACPNSAIEVAGPANARVVNLEKCTGCRLCQAACPWGMTSFDEQLKKATKCHLCNGDPECVKACPNAALKYIPWEDRTKDVPVRWTVPGYVSMPANVASTCGACHK